MQCPDCRESLRLYAKSCKCGWSVAPKKGGGTPFERPMVSCAHDGCGFHAFVKIKTPTGYANLCEADYAAHFQKIAVNNCLDRGLSTPAQCRQWIRDNQLRMKNFAGAGQP